MSWGERGGVGGGGEVKEEEFSEGGRQEGGNVGGGELVDAFEIPVFLNRGGRGVYFSFFFHFQLRRWIGWGRTSGG